MIDKRQDDVLRLAIDTLKAFDKDKVFYWIQAYKNIYNLSKSQMGFLMGFLKNNTRNYEK